MQRNNNKMYVSWYIKCLYLRRYSIVYNIELDGENGEKKSSKCLNYNLSLKNFFIVETKSSL